MFATLKIGKFWPLWETVWVRSTLNKFRRGQYGYGRRLPVGVTLGVSRSFSLHIWTLDKMSCCYEIMLR